MRRILLLVAIAYCFCNIKAQVSKVNVTIDGPGVVDEYLMTSADGTKQVKLKAVPSKFLGDVTFDGWSGDATGTSEELTVSTDKSQNIHATFTYRPEVKMYPLLNLKQSWADMGKPMYVEAPGLCEREEAGQARGYAYLPVDYNRDGILDYIEFAKKGPMGIDNHRENVRFWLGQPDGSISEDPKNDNRILGTVYSIIVKYADFNDDGYPDFCSFSSGYDRAGMTGDYPVVLMSSPDGTYTDLRFTDYNHGYFHGGTTGDFDNDGDIDILFWDMNHYGGENSLYLENDGKGNFEQHDVRDIIDLSTYLSTFPMGEYTPIGMDIEVTDLNKDGFNDVVLCGHDHVGSNYISMPIVLWGSASGKFGGANYTQLPEPRLGRGISVGLIFYDLNGDGTKEIIVNKNCDGVFGGTRFYVGGYFQVCELEGDHYVDKTDQYFAKEHEAFNERASEQRSFIEEIDGVPYLCVGGAKDYEYIQGVGVGPQKLYALKNGVFEVVEPILETSVPAYNEGFPIYVDGPNFVDCYNADDGINPIDTLPEHRWVDISDWDCTWGNMWRINLHHRKDTHFGRTCIRWNRDGLDPAKREQHENQSIDFHFVSDVNVKNLMFNDYYLEFYIKNSDPDLSLIVNGITIDVNNTEEGEFTGEWQRVLCPLRDINHSSETFNNIYFEVDKGDHNNEFYLDDIRIRRLTISETRDEYERAFSKGFVDGAYAKKDRTKQITSKEFKAMLKPLVEKFAPDSIDYFNYRISDYDVPIIRGTAAIMAYYVARCLDVTNVNSQEHHSGEANFWDGAWGTELGQVLPHANDPLVESPDGWQESICALLWNDDHISPFSGRQVVAYVGKGECYAWDKPFTWEDAICAITRLYDSLDPERVAVGISMPIAYPTKAKDDVFFNMNGQRVPHPLKGVYIKNGKKVIIRSEQH
jgi:hypothetical protein